MKTREIKIKKFTKKRVVLFIIAIFIAVSSLSYGIWQLIKDDGSEWVTVDVNKIKDVNNESITPYSLEVLLFYFPQGDKASRNSTIKAVTTDFNYALSEYYMLFDADYGYKKDDEVIHNLHYINTHPNVKIEVNPNLYDVLKDAYQYMIDTDGVYNIFAGELLYYYQVQVLDIGNEDPIDKPERLSAIVEKINDYKDNKFDLLFEDETYSVTFYVEEGYDLEDVQINLQFLSQAYAIEGISNYLVGKGYDRGFVCSTYYNFYSMLGEEPTPKTGGFWRNPLIHPLTDNSSTYILGEFLMNKPHNNVEIGYQKSRSNNIVKSSDVIYHPFYNAKNGLTSNEYHYVTINSTSKISEIAKEAFILFNLSDIEQENYISNNGNEKSYYFVLKNQGSRSTGYDDLLIKASQNVESYSQYVKNSEIEVDYLYID